MSGSDVAPKVEFTYYDESFTNILYEGNTLLYCSKDGRIRWIAPKTITDARKHVTSYEYMVERMPVQLTHDGAVLSMDRPVVREVKTADGKAFFGTVSRSVTNVVY